VTEPTLYTRQIERQGKVPVSTKIFQGFGGIVNSHKDFAFNTFLLLYYSQILGLPASLVSIVIAISLVIDAISDPVVGSISDNYKSRLGRRHPFMIASAVPFGLTLYLLFIPPTGLGDAFLLAWLLFFTVAARLAFTFFIVPWSAIAAEFSNDYVERTSIITYRYMVGWAGGVAFTVFAWSYLFPNSQAYPAGQLDPTHYPTFGLVVGCLVILWALISSLGTRREIPYLLQPVNETPKFSARRTFDEVMLALQSANFRLLFLVFLAFSGLAGVGGVFDIYMNTYFWGFTPDDLRWFAFAAIGAICAFITVPILQRSIDKHTLLQLFLSLYMVGAILKVCFRFWDIWPDNGDPWLLYLLIVHAIVMTYLLTTCGIMVGSLIADLMDEQELVTRRRQEGVFSAAISFSAKATSSIGLIIGGFLLDFVIRFPKQAELGSVDESTLVYLAVCDGVAIPMLFFIPIYLMSRMTMTRLRLAEIQASLEERRRGAV
jgi:GPH family glycoside/pentoside/hexuronide:cation symporter